MQPNLLAKPLIYLTVLVGFAYFTSQLALCFSGIDMLARPLTLIDLLKHGFYVETLMSFLMVALITFLTWGLVKKGFMRYLAYLLTATAAISLIVFLLGYEIFCSLYLDTNQGLFDLTSLPRLHYEAPSLWQKLLITEACVFALALIIAAFFLFERVRPAQKSLGNAHFSSGFETQAAGFFKNQSQSIIIGKKYGAPLYSNGFEHVLVFAPTGSGKTRSIGIPNLFHYPYSVVCNDVKLSLFETTSGYRESVLGHACYCWAPASEERITHCYNPLALISEDKIQRLTDIQRIAHILMPDNAKSDPIWQQASRKLFKVVVLYLLDTPDRPVTLGEINRLIKQEGFDDWLASILDETEHLDPDFYRNGYSYLNNHEKTRSGILETFSGYFELFDDPNIDAATAHSDFDIRDLRRKKITIYIGFTDDDMERLAPLLTLFWQQLISVMIKRIPDLSDEPYPLLCLIDEFSSLGRIERLRRSLKLLREYRVRCVLMFQYIAQTYEKYSHDEAKAFINIKTKIAYTTEDMSDAEFISKMLGTRTQKMINRSTSNQHHGISESKSISYQATPLMQPDAIMKMSADIALIIRSGCAPVKASQFIWYQERLMKHLKKPKTFVPQQKAIRHAFIRQRKEDVKAEFDFET